MTRNCLRPLPAFTAPNRVQEPHFMLSDRTPPHDLEEEAYVLGSALNYAAALDVLLELLTRDDFYFEPHRRVYDVLAYLAAQGPVDYVGVCAELRKRDWWEQVGGSYLLQLSETGLPVNAEHHCRKVAELGTLRRLLHASQQITELVYARDLEPREVHQAAESLIMGIGSRQQSIPLRSGAEVAGETLHLYTPGSTEEPAVPTGMPTLDDMLAGGWLAGELSIVAGRPSMGKTAIGLEFAAAAARAGKRVAVVILESNRHKIMARLLSGESGVPLRHILGRRCSADEWSSLLDAGDRLAKLPLVVVDESGLDLSQLRSVVRRVVREHRAEWVLIDQLQQIERPKAENENVAFTRIIYGLEQEAKRQQVHLQVLAQLSRANERREEKRPMLSDLRDTGSLEQAAQVVVSIHRPEYYLRHKQGEVDDGCGVVEVGVLKNRDGAVGTVRAQGNLGVCRIWEPDWKHSDADAPPETLGLEHYPERGPRFGND